MTRFAILLLAAAGSSFAGDLTLREAVRQALKNHPSVEASARRTAAASERVAEAHAGLLPRLDYSESWQRSDNPVFVFGALLNQHQFTQANFDIGPLNRPDSMNDFQSVLSAEQTVYDGNATRNRQKSAGLSRKASEQAERRTRTEVIASVVRTYFGSVLARQNLEAARESVRSAAADLQRAETVRTSGMSTDADVLSVRVHLAAMREQEIRSSHAVEVADAALNEALGAPLDAPHTLATKLDQRAASPGEPKESERSAAASRPEIKELGFSAEAVRAQSAAARAALFPQVSVRAVFETDRERFIDRGGANWFVGATLRWNLFNGFGDRARINSAAQTAAALEADQRRLGAAVQLQVRQAWADAKAADERIAVTEATVAMAEESLRITRNRYESGLATVTDLLRTESAVLDARTRRLAAIYDQRVAAANLLLAAGELTEDSNVLD